MSDNKDKEIDDLLNSLFKPSREGLKLRFENKLKQDGLSQRQALKILQTDWRQLMRILEGDEGQVNWVDLVKLARFLDTPTETIVQEFIVSLEGQNESKILEVDKRKFIHENFDLKTLKKHKVISTITDLESIEQSLNQYFGFESIFEFKEDVGTPAFSVGKRHKKNQMVDFWLKSARKEFLIINNFNDFDRNGLIEYFPEIRWHSRNVEKGLAQVIRSLFKLGITIIFRDPVPGLQARGVTLNVNKKPCIVITNLAGFYPTLWFALIHELHHVLFDWEEISSSGYHISSMPDMFTPKEDEADKFARDYLFSDSKLSEVSSSIDDKYYVDAYAENNHIHESIIYAFYCYDNKAWAKYRHRMPSIDSCLKNIGKNPWQRPIPEAAKIHRMNVLNLVQ